MSTSEFGGFVRTDPTLVCQADEPLDAYSVRVLLSNLMHLSDEYSQVRVAWSGSTIAKAYINSPQENVLAPSFAGSWTFPVTCKSNLDSYRFRILLAGAATSGSPATFYAAITAPSAVSTLHRISTIVSDTIYKTSSTSSSTPAWLTGSSQGPEAWSDMITLPGAGLSTLPYEIPSSLGSSDTVTINIPTVTLSIFTQTSDITKPAKLYGVYCAEVLGT